MSPVQKKVPLKDNIALVKWRGVLIVVIFIFLHYLEIYGVN